MVGRLIYLKGHDLLIRAAPTLRAHVPGVKIALIGEGPEEDRLRRLADEQGVADIIVFAGYHKDARRLVDAFDVLAAPSRDEGLSLSIMEAMAYAKPVVATNVGGIPTLVIDGVTGLVTPPENVVALGKALVQLLTNPQEAKEMGRAGREHVRSRFPLDAMLLRTFSLYNAPPGRFPQLKPFGDNSA
jgi:glycosyltransferase involved in cell wall biosynthesis